MPNVFIATWTHEVPFTALDEVKKCYVANPRIQFLITRTPKGDAVFHCALLP